MKARGIHTRPNDGATVDWLTPPEIIQALGRFDFDPCAHPRQFYRTATTMISPPEDGLSVQWIGRVWLNPPYGSDLRYWMRQMTLHGDGIALVPSRTEVESWFWPYVWEGADAILFLKGRIYFRTPEGGTCGNAGHGSVLVAYRQDNAAKLAASGIAGRFFALKER